MWILFENELSDCTWNFGMCICATPPMKIMCPLYWAQDAHYQNNVTFLLSSLSDYFVLELALNVCKYWVYFHYESILWKQNHIWKIYITREHYKNQLTKSSLKTQFSMVYDMQDGIRPHHTYLLCLKSTFRIVCINLTTVGCWKKIFMLNFQNLCRI